MGRARRIRMRLTRALVRGAKGAFGLQPRVGEHPLLHVGYGLEAFPGWGNVDLQPFSAVDVVADVTQGLSFADCRAVFAEHFLEHLTVEDGIGFLVEVHRVLGEEGWLRLSTPNLEWVLATHYDRGAEPREKARAALGVNRAFYGWGHRFLWNQSLLEQALASCGFTEIRWCRYGESELPFFRGLERHQIYEDTEECRHVLIVEARKGPLDQQRLAELGRLVRAELAVHVAVS
jgi:predicted SAM-dependent methyltransferase